MNSELTLIFPSCEPEAIISESLLKSTQRTGSSCIIKVSCKIHQHNKMCNRQETYKRKKNMHAGNALQYIKTKWLTYGKYMTCNEGQKAYLHQPGTEDPSWASHLYNPRPVCKYKLKKLRGQVSNIPSIYIAIPQWIHPRSKKQETAHLVRTEQILHDFLYQTTLKLLWTMSKLNRRYTENQSLSSK